MFPLNEGRYRLSRVGLLRAALPPALAAKAENKIPGRAIVFEPNTKELGRITAAGFCPRALVVSGERQRNILLEKAVTKSWVYVEASLDIHADDKIGSAELLAKLDSLIFQRFYPAQQYTECVPCRATPRIEEVYPFENYCVYSMKGETFRQPYALDPARRDVALAGLPVPVQQKFVQACKDIMPFAETGIRRIAGWTPGNVQSVTYGGRTSELILNLIRDLTNIKEAADMYVDNIRLGFYKPLRPSFYPVQLTDDHHVASTQPLAKALANAGINQFDFAHWTAQQYHTAQGQGLFAGGPGSGRHPGGGTGKNPDWRKFGAPKSVAKTASDWGFRPGIANAPGNIQLYKHDNGAKIYHEPNSDSWTHRTADKQITRGTGHAELEGHLQNNHTIGFHQEQAANHERLQNLAEKAGDKSAASYHRDKAATHAGLAEDLQQRSGKKGLMAGGPGSGRHPGGGKASFDTLHKRLTGRGYFRSGQSQDEPGTTKHTYGHWTGRGYAEAHVHVNNATGAVTKTEGGPQDVRGWDKPDRKPAGGSWKDKAYASLGMTKVRGGLGGVYYE